MSQEVVVGHCGISVSDGGVAHVAGVPVKIPKGVDIPRFPYR